jgi:hypothetical protein
MFLGSRMLTALQPSVSRLCRQYRILNMSQSYRPPRPVTGIALLILFYRISWTGCQPFARPLQDNTKTEKRNKQTPRPEPANELYRPSDRRLSAKLAPTSADRGCRVVSATDTYGRNLGFLDRSRYFSFQVAPQLYSRS